MLVLTADNGLMRVILGPIVNPTTFKTAQLQGSMRAERQWSTPEVQRIDYESQGGEER